MRSETTPIKRVPAGFEHVAVPRAAARVLAACATNATVTPDLPLVDALASRVHERLGGCVEAFTLAELRYTALRALAIDELARRFFEEHPHALGVGAWSMLGTRAHRLRAARWVDVNTPDIAKLRQHLLPKRPGWTQLGACLCCSPWVDAVRGPHGRAALYVLDESVIPIKPFALVHFFDEISRAATTGSEVLVAFDRRTPLRPLTPFTRVSALELVAVDANGTSEFVRYPRLRFVDEEDYEGGVGHALAGVNAVARLEGGMEQPALAHLRVV